MARSYISAEEFRAKPLGISMRQYTDEQLAEYAEIATTAVEDLCERNFEATEYTESLRGTGRAKLIVNNYPITAIDSITDSDGNTVDLDGLVRDDLTDAAGILELSEGSWSPSLVYTVAYTAGYETVPGPVRHAVAVWMSELLKPDFAGPSLDVPDIVPFSTQQIVELLTPYKRRRII